MALAAVFVALGLFWLSTRQFPLWARLAIWLAGAGLLGFAAFSGAPQQDFGLRQAIGDALQAENIGEAAIVQALQNNDITVLQFVPQLLDFFLVAGAFMGVLALLAFTRGQRIEKALRPTILALVAFIAGSAATLVVVAIGLGGQVKPRVHTGRVSEFALNGERSVYDGDTFWLGEASLRLWGVDAPELSQTCGRDFEECGDAARAQLDSLLVGELVQCKQEQSLNSGRLVESFGRPLVKCSIISDGRRIDVGGEMIRGGYAVQYLDDDRFGYSEQVREGADQAIMRRCSLRPDVMRARSPEARAARVAFERDGAIIEGAATMGDCSAQPSAATASP